MSPEASPLVSIVVCTFNGVRYLREQIASLQRQTWPRLEILICDDGSTDGTLELARTLAKDDPRIRVHANRQNLGYNRNFEASFGRASGDFVAVCDQDDIWKAEKIEKLMGLFTSDEVVLVHAASVRFRDTPPDVSHYRARRMFEGNDLRRMMFFNTIAGHNILFRRSLLAQIGRFPEQVFYDWWLVIAAARYGQVRATDEVLTFHRAHDSNVTLGKKDEKRQTRAKAEERLRTVEAILQLPGLPQGDARFAQRLQTALKTLEGRSFSWKLFSFLLREAPVVFFFKKNSFVSRAKMAWRLSFAAE